MDDRKTSRQGAVGTDEPRLPERSLPSYGEPTPETHRKLTREEEAELALKRTAFTRWTPVVLIAFFLLTIAAVPAIQLVAELRGPQRGLPMLNVLKTLPTWEKFRGLRRVPGAHGTAPTCGGDQGRGKRTRRRLGGFEMAPAAGAGAPRWAPARGHRAGLPRPRRLAFLPAGCGLRDRPAFPRPGAPAASGAPRRGPTRPGARDRAFPRSTGSARDRVGARAGADQGHAPRRNAERESAG